MTTYMGSAAAVLVRDAGAPGYPKSVTEFLNPKHSVCTLADSAYAAYVHLEITVENHG